MVPLLLDHCDSGNYIDRAPARVSYVLHKDTDILFFFFSCSTTTLVFLIHIILCAHNLYHTYCKKNQICIFILFAFKWTAPTFDK